MNNPFEEILNELREIKMIVYELQNKTTIENNSESRLIDRKELGRRLGLCELTILRYGQQGRIPEVRIGTAVRYDYEAVLDSLKSKLRGKK